MTERLSRDQCFCLLQRKKPEQCGSSKKITTLCYKQWHMWLLLHQKMGLLYLHIITFFAWFQGVKIIDEINIGHRRSAISTDPHLCTLSEVVPIFIYFFTILGEFSLLKDAHQRPFRGGYTQCGQKKNKYTLYYTAEPETTQEKSQLFKTLSERRESTVML